MTALQLIVSEAYVTQLGRAGSDVPPPRLSGSSEPASSQVAEPDPTADHKHQSRPAPPWAAAARGAGGTCPLVRGGVVTGAQHPACGPAGWWLPPSCPGRHPVGPRFSKSVESNASAGAQIRPRCCLEKEASKWHPLQTAGSGALSSPQSLRPASVPVRPAWLWPSRPGRHVPHPRRRRRRRRHRRHRLPRRRRIIARTQGGIRGSGANLLIIPARRSAPGPPGRSAARVTALLRRMPGIFLLIGRPSACQRREGSSPARPVSDHGTGWGLQDALLTRACPPRFRGPDHPPESPRSGVPGPADSRP